MDQAVNRSDQQSVVLVGGLISTASGPAVRCHDGVVPVFLRQSDLDGACGPHCALMALIALGQVTREEVTSVGAKLMSHPLKRAWSWIMRDYFVGLDTAELVKLVRLFNGALGYGFTEARGARAARWVTEQLDDGSFVIIGIETARNHYDHWALAIGYVPAELDKYRFLLLDPASDAPKAECWNAVFEMAAGGHYGIFEDGWGKRFAAELSGAVAIRRKPPIPGHGAPERELRHG